MALAVRRTCVVAASADTDEGRPGALHVSAFIVGSKRTPRTQPEDGQPLDKARASPVPVIPLPTVTSGGQPKRVPHKTLDGHLALAPLCHFLSAAQAMREARCVQQPPPCLASHSWD